MRHSNAATRCNVVANRFRLLQFCSAASALAFSTHRGIVCMCCIYKQVRHHKHAITVAACCRFQNVLNSIRARRAHCVRTSKPHSQTQRHRKQHPAAAASAVPINYNQSKPARARSSREQAQAHSQNSDSAHTRAGMSLGCARLTAATVVVESAATLSYYVFMCSMKIYIERLFVYDVLYRLRFA